MVEDFLFPSQLSDNNSITMQELVKTIHRAQNMTKARTASTRFNFHQTPHVVIQPTFIPTLFCVATSSLYMYTTLLRAERKNLTCNFHTFLLHLQCSVYDQNRSWTWSYLLARGAERAFRKKSRGTRLRFRLHFWLGISSSWNFFIFSPFFCLIIWIQSFCK